MQTPTITICCEVVHYIKLAHFWCKCHSESETDSIEEHVATNKEYDMTNTHSAMENMQHMDHSVGEFVKINASQKSPSRGPDQHVVCRHCTNIQAIRKKCM